MTSVSETGPAAAFPHDIAREVRPFSPWWEGDALVYRSIIVLSAIALPLIAAVSLQLRGSVAWPQMALAGAMLAGSLLCYGLSRFGRRDIAAAMLIGVIWCSATIFSISSGIGMHSAAVFMYLPCVLYTALFFGPAIACAELALTVAALVLMYLAEENGQLGGVAAFIQVGTNLNFLIGIVATCIGTLIVGVVYHRRVEAEAARVLAEAEQRRVAMELARGAQAQVETAHAKLVALNAELAARDRVRSDEILHASRELGLLRAALAKDLPAARRAGNSELAALAASLVELAVYGSRPLSSEPLDLSALAEEAVRHARAHVDCGRMEFDVDAGLLASGDRELIAALLRRLAEGAARACRGEAQPRVHIGAGSLQGRPVYFVRDNGPGVCKAQRALLFQPFGKRASEPDTTVACARLIAERHGGRLNIASAPGEGTTVYFSLRA